MKREGKIFLNIGRSAREKGFILLFSLLISSVILSAGLAVTRIIIRQIYLASVQRDSQMAFFAADSGIECIRYWKDTADPSKFPAKCNNDTPMVFTNNIGASLVNDVLNGKNNITSNANNPIKTWFNTGGQEVTIGGQSVIAPLNCVKLSICNKSEVGTECSDAPNGKIIARGYNVPCDSNGNPEGGRVVERKLVFQYR